MKRIFSLFCLLTLVTVMSVPFPAAAQENAKHPPITPQNAAQVKSIARLGRGILNYVAWSPDGNIIALASGIGVWLYQSNNLEAAPLLLADQAGWVTSIAFSPDGSLIAAAYWDSTVLLWDIKTSKVIARLEGHTDTVTSIAFSPDGSLLASASLDYTIRFWDVKARILKTQIKNTSGWVTGLSFSADGAVLAANNAASTNRVQLWNVKTGQLAATLPYRGVSSVTFSPKGSTLATGNEDGTVRLWNVKKTGYTELSAVLPARKWSIFSLSFSGDGSRLAFIGPHQIDVWDSSTLQPIGSSQIQNDGDLTRFWHAPFGSLVGVGDSLNVALSPQGSRLVLIADDRLQIWDILTGELKLKASIQGPTGRVNKVAFSPDGKVVASAGWDQVVRLWDVNTGLIKAALPNGNGGVNGLAFSPDGALLAAANWDKQVRLWNMKTGQSETTIQSPEYIYSIAFSRDGSVLALGDSSIMPLWDVKTRTITTTLQSERGAGRYIAFGPDGMLLGSDLEIQLWDVKTAKLTVHWQADVIASSLAINPDGSLFAVGGRYTLTLWDIKTRQLVTTLQHNTDDFIDDVAFSPDGALLASTSEDGNLRLWNVKTGQLVATLAGHAGRISSVAFSPDGTLIATGSFDGTVRLWSVDTSLEYF